MAADTPVTIRPIEDADRDWVRGEMRKWWGDELVVIRGEKFYPAEMDGFLAESSAQKAGVILLKYADDSCEIISLTTSDIIPGTGKQLIEAVLDDARTKGALRILVVTTNDNLHALRFYQQLGFVIRDWRAGAVKRSREIKPGIPEIGNYHIPIRDEIELEKIL